jgi:hypothetical protein
MQHVCLELGLTIGLGDLLTFIAFVGFFFFAVVFFPRR